MLLYRLAKTKYASDLSGIGAKENGGRWNNEGTPVVYTGDSAALVILEYLPYAKSDIFPQNLSLVSIDFPDNLSIEYIDASKLPDDWRFYPPLPDLAEIGTAWAKRCETVALCVPSVHVPYNKGKNYILNPIHSDFKDVSVAEIIPYGYYTRILD